jgi:la-related protein 1
MDTEGWISIAMIASFNRIKTYSADVALVKEMMEVSSLLEVQGDHVRIAGDQAKKWVLPDAKPSPFPPSEFTPTPATTAAASVSDTLDTEENDSTAVSDCLSINGNPENAFDMKDMGFGTDVKYQPDEVKAALMKSGSSAGAAAAAPSKPEEDKVDEDVKVNGDAEAR